jgi:hypothetical protein
LISTEQAVIIGTSDAGKNAARYVEDLTPLGTMAKAHFRAKGKAMTKLTPAIPAFARALLSSPSNAAGYDVESFQSFMHLTAEEKVRDVAYLIGVARGLVIMNMYNEQRFGQKLFCIPDDKFEYVYGGSVKELTSEIAQPSSGIPYPKDTVMEVVMLQTLIANYSCEKTK